MTRNRNDLEDDDIKNRLKHREEMLLQRLLGMLAKMAKVDGKVDAILPIGG